MWQSVSNDAVEQHTLSFIVCRRMCAGLTLYLATGNRNSFIQRKKIKSMDDFLIAAESEESLDLSQNRPVKGAAVASAKDGKSLETRSAHLSARLRFDLWCTCRTVFPTSVVEADNRTSGLTPVSSGCAPLLTEEEETFNISCREMLGEFGMSYCFCHKIQSWCYPYPCTGASLVIAELLLGLSGSLCPCSLDGLTGVEERDCSSLAKGVGSCPKGGPDSDWMAQQHVTIH